MKRSIFNSDQLLVKLLLAVTLTFTTTNTFAITNIHTVECFSDIDLPKPQYQNAFGSFMVDVSSTEISFSEFINQLNDYFNLKENHSFNIDREYTDNSGNKIYNLSHYYNNIPVKGNAVFIQEKNGKITYIYGQMIGFNELNTVVKISNDEIKSTVLEYIGTSKNVNFSTIEQVIIKYETENTVELKLAQKISVVSTLPFVNKEVYIDAQTGSVLYGLDKLYTADTPSVSSTLYRGTQQITVDSYNGNFRLKDNARNIHTKNAIGMDGNVNSLGEFTGTSEFTSSSANFNTTKTKPAIDVHWAMSKTYDYYKNVHNRNSYDGNGSIIRNYYNPPSFVFYADNAGAFDNQGIVGMLYGAGDQYFTPVVALDVAGHEFSHLVVSRNGSGGLDYQGESGALNEAFADMFGTAIEFYVNDQPNWTVGEGLWKISQVTPNYLRSLENPNSGPAIVEAQQPDTYKGKYWADTNSADDNGGVHINSGVGNHWFYLLSVGGSGINDKGNNYGVNGIGIQKAEKIAYKALTNGLSSSATYLDVFNATKIAVTNLYGANSNEWNQVVNAWYAVGIGNAPASNINYEMQTKLNIYPNPVSGNEVFIDSSLDKTTTVELFDLTGKQILAPKILDYKTTINVSAYKTGMYILKFKSNSGEYSHKLMIK